MKKLLSFFTILLFMCLSFNAIAQVTIPPANTNTNGDRHPYGAFYGYERTELLYTQAEIGQFGNITQLGFFLNTATAPAASTPVIIKMNTTTATALVGATYPTASTGATTVYTGNITTAQLINGTWVTVTLDVPFTYSADNLLIFVEANYGGGGIEGSTSKLFRRSAPSPAGIAMITWNQDTSPPTTLVGTTNTTRSNAQLTFTPTVSCSVGISNLNPTGTVAPGCTPVTVAPKAKITNAGTMTQTAISVRYQVTSESYDQTVVVPSLAPGANMDVDFPNTLVLSSASPGVKNVTITASATCNGGPVSYVFNTSFTVSAENVNFGGPMFGYYFANSTPGAICAPNQPIYYWEDTTGSTSMILNGVNQLGTVLTGTPDDGFFKLGGILAPTDKFHYDGVDYDSFYVGTNGLIAFSKKFNTDGQLTTFTPLAIPSIAAPRPAIFPFWKDFNFSDVDVPMNRMSYKVSGSNLIITYDRVPDFNTATDATDYTSFQIILQIAPGGGTDNGLIIVQYNDAATGATFLTKYSSATLATHTAGIQNILGTTAIQYRRATPTVVVAGPLFGSPVAVAYGPNAGVLPVELASFTSSVTGNTVNLSWTTNTESNNAGFDIERSVVNGSWSKIGNVAGNGTTTTSENYSFTDRNISSGMYNYRLKQIDFNGNFRYYSLNNEVNVGTPTKYSLSQNYPNPFNPSTSINYEIPSDGKVSLKIFDMSGREVMTLVNEVKTAGFYSFNFNASNLSSGVYFYSLSANNFTATKKMLLVK